MKMRLLGYVSDEMYVALADVQAEWESDETSGITVLRSSPRGVFYGDLPDGKYRVMLARAGYGSKSALGHINTEEPLQFRLLSDSLRGYAGPRWVRGEEAAELCVHAGEQYHLPLWRYGATKEF